MTQIRLKNTLTRKVEPFTPIDPADVRMYVCGPTVYDRAHLGNARPVVVFDVLFRLLRHVCGETAVTYVRNFTDVDDRINETAQKRKAAGAQGTLEQLIRARSDETIRWYHEDMDALGALRPTHEPRATEFIPQMVAMIEGLITKGVAYAAEGHVLFEVSKYPGYGQLSGRSTDDMIAGARVEVAPYKRHPMDFVLWKPSDDDLPGWDSPWGRGRPGWHIECSAMAKEILGETFDIHAGGIDLQFPHHENEIAQSKCACGEDSFAKVWMHNEMLQVEGKKMSKSLGNFFTVRDLLDMGVSGEVIRFVLLKTHYSKPMDWTRLEADSAEDELKKWLKLCEGHDPDPNPPVTLVDALADDLNTPLAIAELRRFARDKNAGALLAGARLLGLMLQFHDGLDYAVEAQQLISELIAARENARRHKRYDLADGIRNGMAEAGVSLSDGPNGTVGEITKGVLDTWPFLKEFRSALASGDEAKIERARREAKDAGVHFTQTDLGGGRPAWVGPPTASFVVKRLRSLITSLDVDV